MAPSATESTSPSALARKSTIKLHALSAGHLTLPERFFVHPASQTARRTVPSLSFLLQHQHPISKKITRIVFDLGLRRNIERYSEPIRRHAATRSPLTTDPDVVKSLAAGGLTPDDIDYIIYSHVHWDHVGEPRDFRKSTFVVGNGALNLLRGTCDSLHGSHSFFEANLIPPERTIELQDPREASINIKPTSRMNSPGELDFHQPWKPIPDLPHTIDLFNDGSLYIVDAPGHLPGHINLLVRTSVDRYVYLAGDACHDRRIMRKQRDIGEWHDDTGRICCIHADREIAEKTIDRIRKLEQKGVEIIFAHDIEWEEDPRNTSRFLGPRL
ncbi:hypothetical protein NECHADRAFT_41144 [Paecilomyces variotii No. 5]|uniref:Metallo-beta-lactamase domain-containing protein n=1 Tax=Byssochlamys spectabilis (strain No. 5 / NBRC 109023) TaxID=1356009 RepID=V5I612_BYSSN|nr:hypothetical protein NECHADRAFT_41144 [Paecilomyces variotii No. 5]